MKKTLIYCCSIQIIFLVTILLFDQRSYALPNPSTLLPAISIAVSYLIYDVENYVGLEQVYKIISEVNSYDFRKGGELVSGFFVDNYTGYKQINLLLNEKILEASQINISGISKLHGYANDGGYLYYTIVALKLFGLRIQSLSYLFTALIIFPSILFLISLKNNRDALYLLMCLISSIIFIVYFSFGVDKDLGAVYNPRFLPILMFIPFINIIYLITDEMKNKITNFVIIFLQSLILLFVLISRSSTAWIIIAFFIFSFFYIFVLKNKIYKQRSQKLITILIIPTLLILFSFSFGLYIKKNAHDIYKTDAIFVKHPMWAKLSSGFFQDKKLWKKNVCFDPQIEENLLYFRHISCNNLDEIFPYKSRFINYLVLNNISEDYSLHAAVKYLKERTQPISKIGRTNLSSSENLNENFMYSKEVMVYYNPYEKINKLILFEAIKSDPMDMIIVQFFYKPLKYVYDIFKAPYFFIRSILRSNIPFLTIIFILIFTINYFYSTKQNIKLSLQNKSKIKNEKMISRLIIASLFFASILPSMIFYPSNITIVSSLLTLILTLSFIVPNFIMSKKRNWVLKIIN